MNNHKPTILLTLLLLALATLALNTPQANAHATRELITSFGNIERPAGIAIDEETGNVYVVDNRTMTVKIFGPDGGRPVDGVPTEITGLALESEAFDRNPSGISVDNSCYEHQPRLTGKQCEEYDPAYGDIYVIRESEQCQNNQDYYTGTENRGGCLDKYRLNGSRDYELTEELVSPILEKGTHGVILDGVMVDSRGNLFMVSREQAQVAELKKNVEKIINGSTEEIKESLRLVLIPQHIVVPAFPYPGYVAADDHGHVYIGGMFESGTVAEGDVGVGRVSLGANSEVLSEGVFAGRFAGVPRPVAVDAPSGNVFVGDGAEIAEYNMAGELQLTFGSTEPLGGSLGPKANGVNAIAYDPANGRIYVVNPLHGDVDVFGAVVEPAVIGSVQPPVSGVSRTSVLLGGSASPESGQANYSFEYVPAEEYEPAAPDPYVQGGRTAITPMAGGHTPQAIERTRRSAWSQGRCGCDRSYRPGGPAGRNGREWSPGTAVDGRRDTPERQDRDRCLGRQRRR